MEALAPTPEAMNALLLLTWLAPLAAAPLSLHRRGAWLMPLTPLVGLATALLLPPGSEMTIEWLLLGLSLHLDPVGEAFLLFSAAMWLFAGLYAALTMVDDDRSSRFGVFFLLTCAGNLLVILAGDVVTFYFGFALMGLAATGLVAHRRSQQARRAARVYLGWTLAGEMALFSAVVMLADSMGSLRFSDVTLAALPSAAVALLVLGFGVKLALPGLHFWLPLAYPAAPAAAAAVLSGPMISAGLLGWIRFLPPGGATLAGWSEGLMVTGMAGTSLGVLAGLVQRDPRAVLAYSSVAKMGLVTALFGVALARPDTAPGIVAALVAFAMHHLMVKGALFLGIGEWRRGAGGRWSTIVLGILALALIGAPLTAGAGAKLMMSDALAGTGFDLAVLLGFSTAGTALLMARFMWLIVQSPSHVTSPADYALLAWLALAALAIVLPLTQTALPFSVSGVGVIIAGLSVALVFWVIHGRTPFTLPAIPPGDLLYLLRLARQLRAGRTELRDLRWSPRALLISPSARAATAPTASALLWLSLTVAISTMALAAIALGSG